MRTLIIAGQGLKGAPIRSLLVVLALTLGMLGFIAVLSAERVMTETVTQRALLVGGEESSFRASVIGPRTTAEAIRTMRQIETRLGAQSAALSVEDSELGIWVDDVQLDTSRTQFVTTSLRTVRPFPVVEGAWLSGQAELAPRIVVNEAAMSALPRSGDIRLGTRDIQRSIVVVGVVRDGTTDPQIYANLDDYNLWAEDKPTFNLSLHGPRLVEEDIVAAFRTAVDLGADVELVDLQQTDQISTLSNEIQTTSRVLFVLGALSLLSTIVGILNVGLATARARSKEFALRRTMGATRVHIAVIVILESQILAIAAAAVAFGGSFILFPVVVGAFNAQIGVEAPPFDPRYGLICVLVATITALVSSFVPAILSYRNDLSSVMRE